MRIDKAYSPKSISNNKSLEVADELNVGRKMKKWIIQGDYVCKCPLCSGGFICDVDSLEKIGYCDYCFEEFKLL